MHQQRFFHRSAKEWRNFGIILIIVVIGGAISYVSIPHYLPGIDAWVGFIVFCGLVSTLAHVIDDVRKSYRSLVGWVIGFLALALIGASFGSVFLPNTLLLPSRILFGVLIGLAIPGPLRMAYEYGIALQKKHPFKESSPTDQRLPE